MNIKDLNNYIVDNSDEFILNALNKSKDIEIIYYVINLTSDLLNGIFLPDEYKNSAINNLKNYRGYEIGEISTYITLIPYVQSSLQQDANWAEKANSFLESYIGYIIGTCDREDFVINMYEMRNILKLSDKFYNGLVMYFEQNYNHLVENIIDKLN